MSKSSKMHRKKAATTALAAPYVPTPAEGTALSQVLERQRNAKPYIEAKIELKGGRRHISWDHPSQDLARTLWADGLGTDDMAFGGLVLGQLAQIAATGPELTHAVDRQGIGAHRSHRSPACRVPTLIISPFARRGFVDHTLYDTTSILKMIGTRYGLAPLAQRDAHANDLLNSLDLYGPAH